MMHMNGPVAMLLGLVSGYALGMPGPSVEELLGARCEQGDRGACQELVVATKGQCSGPDGSGCQFSLAVMSVPECVTDSECEGLVDVEQ